MRTRLRPVGIGAVIAVVAATPAESRWFVRVVNAFGRHLRFGVGHAATPNCVCLCLDQQAPFLLCADEINSNLNTQHGCEIWFLVTAHHPLARLKMQVAASKAVIRTALSLAAAH